MSSRGTIDHLETVANSTFVPDSNNIPQGKFGPKLAGMNLGDRQIAVPVRLTTWNQRLDGVQPEPGRCSDHGGRTQGT